MASSMVAASTMGSAGSSHDHSRPYNRQPSSNKNQGVRPISKSSDYHFISHFGELINAEEPSYFQVIMKSPEYDEYLFDSHMELYDVTPNNSFSWPGVLEYARALNNPALFLIKSDLGIDRSNKFISKLNHLFFILYIPSGLASRCSYLKSTNRNYYADNLWDNNMPSSCQARRYKQMQLKLLPLLEEYDVETLQFTDIAHFEKYHKLLKSFNKKWSLQHKRASIQLNSGNLILPVSNSEPSAYPEPWYETSPIEQDNLTVDMSDVSDQVSTSRQMIDSSEDYNHGLTIDSATEEHDRSSPTDMKPLSGDHEKELPSPISLEGERDNLSSHKQSSMTGGQRILLDVSNQEISSNNSSLHSFA